MIRNVRFIQMGSGTSSGVPVIGCDCKVCQSDDPRDNRLRCGACICFTDATDQERVILIDTTPDLRQQALHHQLDRCDCIFFTHNHVDHVFGLDEVRRFNVLMKSPIDVYADQRTFGGLFPAYRHIFEPSGNLDNAFVASLISHLIEPEQAVIRFGLRCEPLRVLHGRLPVLGFRLEAVDESGNIAKEQPGPLPLAYCTDVSSIPPETWPRLTGLNTLLLDMLRYRHHPTHLSLDQAIDIADSVSAHQTWFIHMTHDILHAELDPQLPQGISLAYDGLVLT